MSIQEDEEIQEAIRHFHPTIIEEEVHRIWWQLYLEEIRHDLEDEGELPWD